MKYKIIGTSKRIPWKDCFGEFDNLNDATKHMNKLKMSMGESFKFVIKENKYELEEKG